MKANTAFIAAALTAAIIAVSVLAAPSYAAGNDSNSSNSGSIGNSTNITNSTAGWQPRNWYWTNIAQESLISVNLSNSPMTNITFLTNNAITQGGMQASASPQLPPGIPSPPGKFYAYIMVTGNGLYDSDINGFMKITYKIPIVWIENNKLDTQSTRLYHYDDNTAQWSQEPTIVGNASGQYYYFTSFTKNFGRFAIASSSASQVPSPAQQNANDAQQSSQQSDTAREEAMPHFLSNHLIKMLLVPLGIIVLMLAVFLMITSHYNSEAEKLKKNL